MGMVSAASLSLGPSRVSPGFRVTIEGGRAVGSVNQIGERGGLASDFGHLSLSHSASLSSSVRLSSLAADPTVLEYAVWIFRSRSLLTLLLSPGTPSPFPSTIQILLSRLR